MPICEKCGYFNFDGIKACKKCGVAIDADGHALETHIPPAPKYPPAAASQLGKASSTGSPINTASTISEPVRAASRKSFRSLIVVAIIMLIVGFGMGRAILPTSITQTQTIVQSQTIVQPQTIVQTETIVQTPTAQFTSAQTAAGQWTTIATFTGSESKDSQDFNVPADYWRIVYTISAANQYSTFYLFVYPSGETKIYVASVTFTQSGTDTSYIRAGPGGFWLHVIAANLSSWSIEIQIQQ